MFGRMLNFRKTIENVLLTLYNKYRIITGSDELM